MSLTRTRRRILIATLVVVAVFAGVYRMLTKDMDSRFLGKWAVAHSKHGTVVWEFGRFGTCEIHIPGESSGHILWHVRDGKLTSYAVVKKNRVSWLKQCWEFVVERISHGDKPTIEYEIRSATPDEIQLHPLRSSTGIDVITLRRVRE
jgi:hypothetical protein